MFLRRGIASKVKTLAEEVSMSRSATASTMQSLALSAVAAVAVTACLPAVTATAVEPKASLTINSGTLKPKARAAWLNMTATCHGGGEATLAYAVANVQGRSYAYEREVSGEVPNDATPTNVGDPVPSYKKVSVACDGKPHDLKVKLRAKSTAWPAAGTGRTGAALNKSGSRIAETKTEVPFRFE
jgi:hypothetical protein